MTTTDRVRRALLFLGLLAAVFALHPTPDEAHADVESGTPVFSDPTNITNDYLPFHAGSVTVHTGRERGASVVLVTRQLTETRDFSWNGDVVTCCVAETLEFRRGKKIATERSYLAQSDAGGVWAFGDVDEEDDDPDDDNGDDADEPSGWIVGQRAPTDPPDAVETDAPALHMPAAPAKGDQWFSESIEPHFLTRMRVKQRPRSVRVRHARFADVIRVRVSDVVDGDAENRWYARGVGMVRLRGPGERLSLSASTVRNRR